MGFPDEKVLQWAENIDRYFFELIKTGENKVSTFIAYRNTFAEILETVSRIVAPKEQWKTYFLGGTVPLIKSDKFYNGFHLGTWLDAYFYLEAPMHYSCHIHRMPDVFWKTYLELHNYGKSPIVPKNVRIQTKNTSKNSLYKLIQNYILLSLEMESENIVDTDTQEDIGSIEVMWPRNIRIEEFINNVFEVFKRVYQINYMLYRREYISLHSKKKLKK
jgi:hypothetical protein